MSDSDTTAGEERLAAKYGTAILDHPPSATRSRVAQKLAQRDAVDQHFAKISLEFASGVCRRPALDRRTRFLVQLGQFTVTKSHGHLDDALRAAIEARVPPREALEAILLCHIYSGETVLEPALTIFTKVARECGVLEAMRDGQLPLDGHDRDRELEAERKTWKPDEASDPRREHLMAQFGWRGVSTGLRYRGRHHLDSLADWDRIDPEFGRLWETFVYQGMYSRWVLDDKTRLLCTMADCIALGAAAAASARDHMEEALEFGNSPREILEVILMTGLYFGFPGMSEARRTLVRILADQHRLAEIGNPRPPKAGT